jgi:hypothetical protein
MDEGVVERGEDVSYAEHQLTLSHLRTQLNLHLLLRLLLSLPWCHVDFSKKKNTTNT